MNFWDTSALVPLVLPEARSNVIRELLIERPGLIVWWATRVECVSALWRRHHDGVLDIQALQTAREDVHALLDAAVEILPRESLRRVAERLLATHPLRSADALQLAAALAWTLDQPLGRGFVSLDLRLRTAAGQEGFTLLPVTL